MARKGLIRKISNAATTPPVLKGKCIEIDGQYCFADRVRFYILNETFDYEKYRYERGQKQDMEKVFKDMKKMILNNCDFDTVVHVDIEDLKAYEKAEKENMKVEKRKMVKPYVIKTEKFSIGFNAKYLLELCEMFDSNVIYCCEPHAPACCRNEQGEWGILLPIRIKEED